MSRYQLFEDVWNGHRWTEKPYSKSHSTITEAADAFRYLSHHNGELGKRLSIREVTA